MMPRKTLGTQMYDLERTLENAARLAGDAAARINDLEDEVARLYDRIATLENDRRG